MYVLGIHAQRIELDCIDHMRDGGGEKVPICSTHMKHRPYPYSPF